MIGRVYAESGSHGTGKTTAVLGLTCDLKISYPGKRIAPLIEQASICPPNLTINKEATRASQMWLFTSQISQELSMLANFDFIVSDRCAVDVIAYTKYLGYDQMATDMLSMVRHHMPIYKQINFRFISENPFWHADGLRESEDKIYRQDIERILLEIYYELGIEFKITSKNCLPGAGIGETGKFFPRG